MTNLEKYMLSVFERCDKGIISNEERDVLLESVLKENEIEETGELTEYEESVLERMESGRLTEEEAMILLESNRMSKEFDKARRNFTNEISSLNEKINNFEKIKEETDSKKVKNSVDEKIKNIKEQIKDLKTRYNKTYGNLYFSNEKYGNMSGLSARELGRKFYSDESIELGKQLKNLNRKVMGDPTRKEQKPGRYNFKNK